MSKKKFSLNQKSTIIVLRWIIILILFFFLTYTRREETILLWKKFFLIFSLYVLSNIIFIFLPLKLFLQQRFNYFIFLLDTILITLGIYFTQGFNTDIYLAYFLVIFMCGIRQDIKGSALIGLIAGLLYFVLLIKGREKINLLDSGVLLRIPFLFMAALFSSHLSEQVKLEEERMRSRIMQVERLLFLGESISGIVHQVKHPLSSIVANCQLMLREETKENFKQRAKKINEQIMDCSHMVDKLLEFARLDTIGIREVNINTLIDNTLELTEDQLAIDNIKVIKKFNTSLPKIDADPTLLQQVFLNIIRNAHQAMFSLSNKGGEIVIETEYNENNLKIKFTDTGPGIPEENLEKIFEPFFTTKKAGEGTGLGLNVAKTVIEKHQGKIYALSKIDKGASIIIELPIQKSNLK